MNDPENKLKGNAYARACNKVRAYAQSLSWDIRLKRLDGIVELEKSEESGICTLKYTSPTAGSLSLLLNPISSQIILRDSNREEYTFPIYSQDNHTDFIRGGVEQALYAFSQKAVKKAARSPRMNVYI